MNKELEYEEEYHGRDKKEMRKERRRLGEKDRSKYKKSDLDKAKLHAPKPPCDPHLLRGRVLAVSAIGVVVDATGALYLCTLKGALKQEKKRVQNLVAVGDFVLIDPQSKSEGTIVYIEERHSILSRQDPIRKHREQLIAVNIDQVLITSSVVLPPLKPHFIDRTIIAAEKGNMVPVILFNKIDYFTHPPTCVDQEFLDEERALFEELRKAYQNAHIRTVAVSAKTGEGIEELKEVMHHKASVFTGQSGTGKSSLINCALGTHRHIGEVIAKTMKGSHTTTEAHLIPIEEGGFCIDTPGIRSLGVWDLSLSDVKHYYQEIDAVGRECRFEDCNHLGEAGCAVLEAVEQKRISPLRFASYLALMQSMKENFKKR